MAFFDEEATEHNEESLYLWMRLIPYDDLVVVDITANESLASYEDFASYGFHVISANKIAGSASSVRYRATRMPFQNRSPLVI